ncbi:RluA family pseudouridine synthase [Parvicella tangerina]|uniref:Pseudouridine synthase RsuA/RluA-like domain-containing protein n=1 Tax=Parvicella tangerina TaxID=2829795 RepID=A0A916JN41_9FLAO|nr:RluA family pseudouridine synthase [Parvicella tangerina]CAG5082139.1 hypothetical protein CRYO30217_01818 [Parvicella tangerina]
MKEIKPAETHIVPHLKDSIRLSDYAKGIFELIPTRKGMKKAIDKGYVFVNGEKSSTARYISTGDKIELMLPETFKKGYERTIDVVYEDDDFAVVNKPAGLLSNGNSFKTLENTLAFNLKKSKQKDALFYPQVAHRLDYPTSGLIIVSKTRAMNVALKQLFKTTLIKKTYHAITVGEMKITSGKIDKEIDGKPSTSHFKVITAVPSNKYQFINLVKLEPVTGRRHQLRIHLASLGFPILGDRNYGSPEHWDMKRGLYLAATSISFKHPFTQEDMQFTIEIPKKFKKLIKV